jgi:hypothetical protein
MRFLLQLLVTIILSFILQTYLPWWTMALGALAVGYVIGNKSYVSFLAGFMGTGLLWLGVALSIDIATHSILTQKVNQLLPVNSLLLTTLVGGLVGGFAGLTGSLLKAVIGSR